MENQPSGVFSVSFKSETSYSNEFSKLTLRIRLSEIISQIIEEKEITQKEAARICGVDQSKISKIITLNLYGVTTDFLFMMINKLGYNVEIKVG